MGIALRHTLLRITLLGHLLGIALLGHTLLRVTLRHALLGITLLGITLLRIALLLSGSAGSLLGSFNDILK